MPDTDRTETMTLTDHLDELRSRIIRSALYLVAGMALAWFAYWEILGVLAHPFTGEAVRGFAGDLLRAIDAVWLRLHVPLPDGSDGRAIRLSLLRLMDAFWLRMQTSFIAGIILAMPFILWELWRFVSPGLTAHERRVIRGAPLVVFCLLILGAAFGYLMTPLFVVWLTGAYFVDPKIMEPRFTPEGSVLWIAKLMLAFGLGFQLPVLVVILNRVGILPLAVLRRHWREATLVIFAIAAIITPTWDPFSMTIAALPIALLYLGTLAVISVMERRDRKAALRAQASEGGDG